ncbi:hypothetical protein TIFTF001_054636 [Ficus carica]|uniref:Uncharacterized protein n=1 Tax=Ficus carica TaxID=3494 RepID=A0AA88EBZ3_FICCA|nr:hypothetical protein TIFTF001_054636 [Ficus carica]
MKLHPRGRL